MSNLESNLRKAPRTMVLTTSAVDGCEETEAGTSELQLSHLTVESCQLLIAMLRNADGSAERRSAAAIVADGLRGALRQAFACKQNCKVAVATLHTWLTMAEDFLAPELELHLVSVIP